MLSFLVMNVVCSLDVYIAQPTSIFKLIEICYSAEFAIKGGYRFIKRNRGSTACAAISDCTGIVIGVEPVWSLQE